MVCCTGLDLAETLIAESYLVIYLMRELPMFIASRDDISSLSQKMDKDEDKLIATLRQSLHDINGAFTGVVGLAEYLATEEMDQRHKELILTMVESCERMSNELNQLRIFLDDYLS